MRARVSAAALLVLFAALGPARGDYDETEQRLKGAGVDAGLRTKVHKGIDRCVEYLASQQRPDGSFECILFEDTKMPTNTEGVTLLCALALRHAGTPATTEPVARSVTWLFDGKDSTRRDLETSVYEAGIALMLLHAVGRYQPEAPRLASALARALDGKTGWWGYDTPGPALEGTAGEPPPHSTDVPNISTAQFAALGLWAARRMGIETHPSVWRRHAESLLASQSATGSWPYGKGIAIGPPLPPGAKEGKAGYFTGTCMGLANLLLAKQALKGPPAAPGALLVAIDVAIDKALTSLRQDAPVFLEDPGAGEIRHTDDMAAVLPPGAGPPPGVPRMPMGDVMGTAGIGTYYSLYALEKACLFADLESFQALIAPEPGARKPAKPKKGAKIHWYSRSAEWLLSMQEEDGGWSLSAGHGKARPSNVVDSALALLILVRSPSTAHPTTPREVDARPRGPVTPGDAPPPQKPK